MDVDVFELGALDHKFPNLLIIKLQLIVFLSLQGLVLGPLCEDDLASTFSKVGYPKCGNRT